MTRQLINANRESQGTKQINSPDRGREASFKRDTDRLTVSRGMKGWRDEATASVQDRYRREDVYGLSVCYSKTKAA